MDAMGLEGSLLIVELVAAAGRLSGCATLISVALSGFARIRVQLVGKTKQNTYSTLNYVYLIYLMFSPLHYEIFCKWDVWRYFLQCFWFPPFCVCS